MFDAKYTDLQVKEIADDFEKKHGDCMTYLSEGMQRALLQAHIFRIVISVPPKLSLPSNVVSDLYERVAARLETYLLRL